MAKLLKDSLPKVEFSFKKRLWFRQVSRMLWRISDLSYHDVLDVLEHVLDRRHKSDLHASHTGAVEDNRFPSF